MAMGDTRLAAIKKSDSPVLAPPRFPFPAKFAHMIEMTNGPDGFSCTRTRNPGTTGADLQDSDQNDGIDCDDTWVVTLPASGPDGVFTQVSFDDLTMKVGHKVSSCAAGTFTTVGATRPADRGCVTSCMPDRFAGEGSMCAPTAGGGGFPFAFGGRWSPGRQ